MTKNQFLQEKEKLLKRKEELQKKLEVLQEEEDDLREEQERASERIGQLAASGGLLDLSDDELRKRMYDEVERVTVYSSREIEIAWKLGNVFETVV